MRYLAILECPVIFSGENDFGMTSMDMCPSSPSRAGSSVATSRWWSPASSSSASGESEFCAKLFFDAAWTEKAQILWEDRYQLRLEAIDEARVA